MDPFHLVSTPMALLPHLGLRAQLGLSGEDPAGRRHPGLGFTVWLTVYDPDGRRVERRRLGELKAGERRAYDLTELTAKHGFKKPYLCVAHRVPDTIPERPDFDLYRSVVQYARPGGGRGSVIYETPPRLNAGPGGAFLCFTNQAVVGGGMSTHLLVLHYSVAEGYDRTARRRLILYAPDGRRLLVDDADVRPFTAQLTDLGALLGETAAPAALQRSVVVCSPAAAMIPLLLNLHEATGGVSVEHTHPPLAYLGLPPAESARLRAEAISHYMAAA